MAPSTSVQSVRPDPCTYACHPDIWLNFGSANTTTSPHDLLSCIWHLCLQIAFFRTTRSFVFGGGAAQVGKACCDSRELAFREAYGHAMAAQMTAQKKSAERRPVIWFIVAGVALVCLNLLISVWNAPVATPYGRGRLHSSTRAGSEDAASRRVTQEDEAPKPVAKKRDDLTHEACFAQSDESETCFYDGPICYDGEKAVVFTNDPVGNDVRGSMCYDFRHFVASQSCGYNGPHRRDGLKAELPVNYLQDEVPRLMSVRAEHKWGPLGREVSFREMHPSVLNNLEGHNLTVHWLEDGLYIAGVHHSWLDHVWHFAAAAMGLFDVKRYNRSNVPADNSLQTGGMWDAPPMRYLLVAGQYRPVDGMHELTPWIRNLLSMLIQNTTHILWNRRWQELGVDPKYKWICSRRGAVLGLKPRMFNSIGDAQVFRQLAYSFAGIQGKVKAKDDWPPRQITLMSRIGSRSMVNINEVAGVLSETGLKFEWVQEMGKLTWAEQVEVMAKSGILIAIHGAGLANVMFMPAHSVVIEVFPYVMYASMYRDVASAAGLYYYRIQSIRPPNESTAAALVQDDVFIDKCDGDSRHISSPAAFLDYECNWRSKSSPIMLDINQLKYTLSMALDDIGCRDSFCEMGWEHVNMRKQGKDAA